MGGGGALEAASKIGAVVTILVVQDTGRLAHTKTVLEDEARKAEGTDCA